MMEIIAEHGSDELAKVYVAKMRNSQKHLVELVESIQPPIPRNKKWVLIVSTLFGCPVSCKMCDAGISPYKGPLTSEEIIEEIDYMVNRRFPEKNISIPKFKIQFARMGDPALNKNTLDVLKKLPSIYNAPGLLPSISTIAPSSSSDFLTEIIDIKNNYYSQGRFQLQFSIHTTDKTKKQQLIPIKTLSFSDLASYGKKYYQPGDKKITLNFAICKGYPVEVSVIRSYFNPDLFIIKLTPINPTENAKKFGLQSYIDPHNPSSADGIVESFKQEGYDVILSIGEVEENKIGSNCGMFLSDCQENSIKSRVYA